MDCRGLDSVLIVSVDSSSQGYHGCPEGHQGMHAIIAVTWDALAKTLERQCWGPTLLLAATPLTDRIAITALVNPRIVCVH
jgi:hypothetical protein